MPTPGPQPLQKQYKQFFYTQGIDTKIYPDATPIGKLHLLQNAKMTQFGVVKKRYGMSLAPTAVAFQNSTSVATLPTMKKLLTLNDALFAVGQNTHTGNPTLPSEDRIYSFNSTLQAWPDLGSACSVIMESFEVGSSEGGSGFNVSQRDIATNGSVVCVVTGVINGNIAQGSTFCLIDANTSETIWKINTVGLCQPRTVWSATLGAFIICYLSSSTDGKIYYATINPTTLTYSVVGSFITTFWMSDNTSNLYDIVNQSVSGTEYLYVMYKDGSASGRVTINRYAVTNISSGSVVNTVLFAVGFKPVYCLSIFLAGTDIGVAGSDASNFFLGSTSASLSIIQAPTSVATAVDIVFGSSNVINSLNTIFYQPHGTNTVQVTHWNHTSGSFSLTGFLGKNNYQIASRPFTYNGADHILLCYVSTGGLAIQNSLFLFFVDGNQSLGGGGSNFLHQVLGRMFYGEAIEWSGVPNSSNMPSVVALNSSKFITVKATSVDRSSSSLPPVQDRLIAMDFSNSNAYQNKSIGRQSLHTGGSLKLFDGSTDANLGFLIAPEPPTVASQTTGGSMTLTGVYSYVFVLKWLDAKGHVYRSAPSVPLSVTLTGSNNAINFNLPNESWGYASSEKTLNFAALAANAYVTVEAYRTIAAGTTYFFNNFLTSQIALNSPPALDNVSDTTIGSAEILYTTGGVLEHDALDACRAITTWDNRAWMIIDNELYYSNSFDPSDVVNASEFFILPTDRSGGRLTGVAALLNNLLIFTKTKIYYITGGGGPNNTGAGTQYTIPELIDNSIGCFSQSSIVETGNDVMFQAGQQYWTIDAGLNIQPTGQEISHFLSESTVVNQASIFQRDNEVRIQTDNEQFVYNQVTQTWMRNTGLCAGKSFALYNGVPYGIDVSGRVVYENQASFQDAGTPIELRVITGWINLGAITGFQRVWKVFLHNRYYSDHTLNVNVYYDYLPKVVDTYQFVASSANLANFTNDNEFTSVPYSGGGDPYTIKLGLSRQKCQAVRFEIFDSNQSGSCRSLDLISISMVLGIKDVGAKLPATRNVASI